jgi:hypothetical protein
MTIGVDAEILPQTRRTPRSLLASPDESLFLSQVLDLPLLRNSVRIA